MGEIRALSLAQAVETPLPRPARWASTQRFDNWRATVRQTTLSNVAAFVGARRATERDGAVIEPAGEILHEFASGGKCLRSTFMYLGWLCGAEPCDAALRAAASLELLHVFALLQDDVMDDSTERRGRPAVHVQLAQWHRARNLSGSAEHFGASAAILLGDLCLIWAEQMLRESGVESQCLRRAWPRYDAMRAELAVGQFADLASDVRDLPPLDAVLDVARRKSGNYTVRRPLEIGAAMAGCDESTLFHIGRYGAAVGEAFQLRDDILGVFGSPAVTGKPSSGDLLERKATSLVLIAHRMTETANRHELTELMSRHDLDEDALERWRTLIVASGAVQQIEEMIDELITSARKALADMTIDGFVREALDNMAGVCTDRAG